MVPEATLASVQPAWVQVAEKPSNVPFSGWVTTTFWESRTIPPPTGTSAVATRVVGPWPVPPSPPSVPPAEVSEGGSPAAAPEDPPPHAVSRGRARPLSAAPVRARRRVVPGSVTGRLLEVGYG